MQPYESDFLKVIRAAIRVRQVPKKQLARAYNIEASLLSRYITGERPLPTRVMRRLIRELNLEDVIADMDKEGGGGSSWQSKWWSLGSTPRTP